MTNIKFILYFILSLYPLAAQDTSDLRKIGHFNNAVAISINSMGSIYILDSQQSSLMKVNYLGEILESTGGYGWEPSTFDNATDIRCKNLTLYVSDKNNHRIELFDRNLNYIGVIKSSDSDDISFRFPISVDLSKQGDIFILDSENSRILKYNPAGNISAVIGDYDAGDFILQSPVDLTISDNGLLLVLCSESLFVFDIFGNGISIINFDFNPLHIFIGQSQVFLSTEEKVYSLPLESLNSTPQDIFTLRSENDSITDIGFFENTLYVLTKQTILPIKKNSSNRNND